MLETNREQFFIFFSVFFIGCFLRLYGLTFESFDHDELFSVYCSVYQNGAFAIIKTFLELYESNSPLFNILLHYWIKLLGPGELSIRLLPTLFGIASLPSIFILGKKIFNTNVGLIALMGLSFMTSSIYFSQRVRCYSLLLLSSIWFIYYGWLLFKENRRSYGLYFWSSILANVHFSGCAFVLITLLLFIIVKIYSRTDFKQTLITSVVISIICIPSLILISRVILAGQSPNWFPAITFLTFRNLFGFIFSYKWGATANWGIISFTFFMAVIFVGLLFKKIKDQGIIFVNTLLFAPIIVFTLISFFKPIMIPRSMIFTIPLFLLLISWAIDSIPKKWIFALTLSILFLYHHVYFTSYYTKKHNLNYRELFIGIIEEEKEGSVRILGCEFSGINIYRYYVDKFSKRSIKNVYLFPLCGKEDFSQFQKTFKGGFWVVEGREEVFHKYREILKGGYTIGQKKFAHDVRASQFIPLSN